MLTLVTLVYISPDLDIVLNSLISSLTAIFNEKGNKPRHFTTMYSLANIIILLNYFKFSEGIYF
jgi:hypothetical protein